MHVYVYIDDWLKPYQSHLPNHSKQKASVSELLSIAVVGELLAQLCESTWYWLVHQSFQKLFPNLPEYSRYHRVLRNAQPLLAGLALSVIGKQSQLHLIDSKPLPIAKGKRAEWAKLPEAAKGFLTMGMVYGFKLHALTNEQGLFEPFKQLMSCLKGSNSPWYSATRLTSAPPPVRQSVRTCLKRAVGTTG